MVPLAARRQDRQWVSTTAIPLTLDPTSLFAVQIASQNPKLRVKWSPSPSLVEARVKRSPGRQPQFIHILLCK